MKTEGEFPRILLVTSSAFNPYSGGGITLTNLFSGWPRSRIATLHSECLPLDTSVCEQYYELGSEEIKPCIPFVGWARSHARRHMTESVSKKDKDTGSKRNRIGTIVNRLRTLAGDEFPEVVSLSPALIDWVNQFRPQVLYTLLGSLRYIRLVTLLRDHFKIPFIIHMMDDWPEHLHRRGIFGPWMRYRMMQEFATLVRTADLRMGICETMCEEYERRFNVPFVPFHNPVEDAEWMPAEKRDYKSGKSFRIVYWGSIMKIAQLDSLMDIGWAVTELRASGHDVELIVYTQPYTLMEYGKLLESCPGIRISKSGTGENFISVITTADLLALPVNFDRKTIRYLHLSFPTKLSPYMASGTPILAYGPSEMAQISFVREFGAGHAVTEQSRAALVKAIEMIMQDDAYRKKLGMRAQELALSRYDSRSVRGQFQAMIRKVVSGVSKS